MLIYSGAGILVPVLTFVTFWFTRDFFDYTLSLKQGYFWAHPWAQLLATLIAAGGCYLIGAYFNRHRSKVLIEKESGTELSAGSAHTFFFIPMHWWAFIILIGGIFTSFFQRVVL